MVHSGKMKLTLITLLTSLSSTVTAASTPCGGPPDRQPAWACILCGPNTDQCFPYNATFDELRAGKAVGLYDDIDWKNFVVETPARDPGRYHIKTFSSPNYARLPAGRSGVMQTNNGALMFNFHYGCTDPWLSCENKNTNPRSCIITMSAYCGYARSVAQRQQWTFNYTVGLPPKAAALAFTYGNSYYGPGYGACANYTFSAVSASGGMVDLFLDDVIYKRVLPW